MDGILGNMFSGGSGGLGGILGGISSGINNTTNNPLFRLGMGLANQGGGGMQNLGNAFRGASVGGGGTGGGNYFQQGGMANAANGLTQGIGGNSRAINILRLLQGEGGIGVLPRLHMG